MLLSAPCVYCQNTASRRSHALCFWRINNANRPLSPRDSVLFRPAAKLSAEAIVNKCPGEILELERVSEMFTQIGIVMLRSPLVGNLPGEFPCDQPVESGCHTTSDVKLLNSQ